MDYKCNNMVLSRPVQFA